MGFNSAHAPLCPLVHQMGLLCMSKIEKRAIVDQETDEIRAEKMMTVCATGDHRFGDAAIFLPLLKGTVAYIEDPENFDESKLKANVHYTERKEQ